MTDELENDLRAALHSQATQIPGESRMRLLAVDYNPHSPATRRAFALVGGATIAGAAAVLVSVVSFGAGTSRAFAGWTPVPGTPAGGRAAAVSESCVSRLPTSANIEHARATATGAHNAPEAPLPRIVAGGWHLLISDARGPYMTQLYEAAGGRAEMSCFAGPESTEVSLGGSMGESTKPTDPGQASVTSWGGSRTSPKDGSKWYSQIIGRTGTGVSGVTLLLADGTHVQASVENGWFLAWWPGEQQAISAEVTSTAGEHTQQLHLGTCRLC